MAIPFSNLPATLTVPLFWAEVRPAQTPLNSPNRMLLMGHKWTYTNATFGNAVDNRVYHLSGDDAIDAFGPGSILDTMYRVARKNAPFLDITGICLPPDEAAVTAAGSIEVTQDGNAFLRNGTMQVMIAGRVVNVKVLATDLKADIAGKLRAAINRNSGLPCYAIRFLANYPAGGGAETPEKLRIIAKHPGIIGNEIRIFTRWLRNGVVTLADRLLTVTQPTGGTTVPALTDALAALADDRYDVIVCPWESATLLTAMGEFMDGVSGRWSPLQQLYGHVVNAHNAIYDDLLDYSQQFNDPHLTIMGVNGSYDPTWMWAAAYGAQIAKLLEAPPEMSRPLQGVNLEGIQGVPLDKRFNIQERNALLAAGIACYDSALDGTVRINRAVTTYQLNGWGLTDTSWRDTETMFQAAYFVRAMQTALTGTFPRAALTDNDSGIPGFASPGKVRDLFIHTYKFLERQGLVENVDLFAQGLIVERNEIEANRLDAFMPPDMVNQLRICAVLAETNLQLSNSFLIDGADVTDPAVTA